MEKIKASKVLYIKLGPKGRWEQRCIEKDQTLRLSFQENDHKDYLNKKWGKVLKYYIESGYKKNVATSFVNQIKYFYESGDDVLWITFYGNKLWWCFSKPGIHLLEDKTKVRKVLEKWQSTDIEGNELFTENLSGSLSKTQGFRGTICKVQEKDYVLRKINREDLLDVTRTKESLRTLKDNLIELIKRLHWQDLEILIDLIFRQAGYQRIGPIGKTQKTLDLDLISPVTSEKVFVQVKSDSSKKDFDDYCNKFKKMKEYKKLFYVVSRGNLKKSNVDGKINLLLVEDIAKLAINSGLTNWIIKKVS